MESWERRLIEEMHLLVDHLAAALEAKDSNQMQRALDDLVILGEVTTYLSQRAHEDEALALGPALQKTILDVVALWEKDRGMELKEWEQGASHEISGSLNKKRSAADTPFLRVPKRMQARCGAGRRE